MMKINNNILMLCLWLVLFATSLTQQAKSQNEDSQILIFAASSLAPALENIGQAFHTKTGHRVSFSFSSSAILARQINNGAPADIFISADKLWLNWLENKSQQEILKHAIAQNEIVLASLKTSNFKNQSQLNLTPILAENSAKPFFIAMADPVNVPLGRYAQESLQQLGQLDIFDPYIIKTNSAQATLRFLKSGAAGLAIVYKSDIVQNIELREIYAFPEYSHAPIIYMASNISEKNNNISAAFINFLTSANGQQIFSEFGFKSIEGKPHNE